LEEERIVDPVITGEVALVLSTDVVWTEKGSVVEPVALVKVISVLGACVVTGIEEGVVMELVAMVEMVLLVSPGGV
jgi:hypothetical protein